MSDALYLYGFVPSSTEAPPRTLRGVAGRSVELMTIGPVRAAVSRVPAGAYAPESVEERVHDPGWVSEQGALHERVVTWFVDHGDILPVRLLTLYSGAPALEASVTDRAGSLAAALERLRGLREWDLKISYDRKALSQRLGELSPDMERLDREVAQAPPGRRYLLERKRHRQVSEETTRAAGRLADELHERLGRACVDARRLPLPRDPGDLRVVLSAAYLVSREREEELAGVAALEADRLGALGLEVRFTGPWAPYRFMADDEEGGGRARDGA